MSYMTQNAWDKTVNLFNMKNCAGIYNDIPAHDLHLRDLQSIPRIKYSTENHQRNSEKNQTQRNSERRPIRMSTKNGI